MKKKANDNKNILSYNYVGFEPTNKNVEQYSTTKVNLNNYTTTFDFDYNQIKVQCIIFIISINIFGNIICSKLHTSQVIN